MTALNASLVLRGAVKTKIDIKPHDWSQNKNSYIDI